MAAGLPLLNSMTGDLKTLVQEENLGENYEGGNREQLREALHRLRYGTLNSKARSCEQFFLSTIQKDQVLTQMENFMATIQSEMPLATSSRSLVPTTSQN